MKATPILNEAQIHQFEGYIKAQTRYQVIEKILKVATLILLGVTICSFASLFIIQASSELILGLGVSSALSTGFFALLELAVFNMRVTSPRPDKISPEEIIATLDEYNSKIPTLDPNRYIGKVEKIDLEKGSKIFIKADIHGDYFSLIKHLEFLQKQGYLDTNFNVKEEHKGKIILAFLGDYLDRGQYSFEVINLLMKLKVNNSKEVVLLKGKHESLPISKRFIHRNEHYYYQNEELCQKLDKFFNSLPLSVFVGAKNVSDKYQYTCLTHGAIDPDIDVNEVLNTWCWNERSTMYIRKDKKATLSNRIKNILPRHLRDKKKFELFREIKALENYIKSQTDANLQKLKTLLRVSNIDRKRAKQILSCLRAQDFLLKSYLVRTQSGEVNLSGAQLIEMDRDRSMTSFNWGDITTDYLGPNKYRGTGLCFTPEIIKDYFRIISTENRKVKALRAGHAHAHKSFSINGRKGFIEILPVAGEIKEYDSIRKPIDISQVVTVFAKVKNWRQKMLSRKRVNLHTSISRESRFYAQKQEGLFGCLGF